jgi:hypothetical protein
MRIGQADIDRQGFDDAFFDKRFDNLSDLYNRLKKSFKVEAEYINRGHNLGIMELDGLVVSLNNKVQPENVWVALVFIKDNPNFSH